MTVTNHKLTDFELEQRQGAALKHGAYAYRDRGEQALQPAQRDLLSELREGVKTRPALLETLQEQVVDAIMITRILKNHVIEQVHQGRPIESVTALKALGTFQNSAMRGIALLLAEMPEAGDVIDLDELREKYGTQRADDTDR